MKRAAHLALRIAIAVVLLLWIAIASFILGWYWEVRPAIFPEFANLLANYFTDFLVYLFGADSCEDAYDMEQLARELMSVPIVLIFTYLAYVVCRKLANFAYAVWRKCAKKP